ncbi:histidine kinase [Acidobacteria bacterium AH-259-G07]|nr:histidine kinase [Acidobacteria bacterium AH-259-G07]
MKKTPHQGRRFLRAAGLSAWILSGTPAVLMLLGGLTIGDFILKLSAGEFAVWLGAAVVFLVSFWLASDLIGSDRHRNRSRILLLVQTVAALSMFHLVCTGLETTLLVVVAAQLGLFVPLPVGLGWVFMQTLALGWLATVHWGSGFALAWIVFSVPFEALTLFTSYFAASESGARHKLARANAELRATQELLAESSRIAERSRISRDLHDLLGHYLVALSLNLETALHLSEGKERQQIEKCQSLTKRLLKDLRGVVKKIRGDRSVDLVRILKPLVAEIPRPKIHLNLPDNLEIEDPDRAHAIIRCVQEVITNAAKHAFAENLWIDFVGTEEGLEVRAYDDGQGAKGLKEGSGLRGMRERLEKLGGRLEIKAVPEEGFRLNVSIPLSGGEV